MVRDRTEVFMNSHLRANCPRVPCFIAPTIVASLVCLGLLVTTSAKALGQQPPNSSTAEQSTPDTFDEAAERRVLELLFAERQKAGVAPLYQNQRLSECARLHALQVAKYGEASAQFPGE
jgi:uncharacterized protein YkwD